MACLHIRQVASQQMGACVRSPAPPGTRSSSSLLELLGCPLSCPWAVPLLTQAFALPAPGTGILPPLCHFPHAGYHSCQATRERIKSGCEGDPAMPRTPQTLGGQLGAPQLGTDRIMTGERKFAEQRRGRGQGKAGLPGPPGQPEQLPFDPARSRTLYREVTLAVTAAERGPGRSGSGGFPGRGRARCRCVCGKEEVRPTYPDRQTDQGSTRPRRYVESGWRQAGNTLLPDGTVV